MVQGLRIHDLFQSMISVLGISDWCTTFTTTQFHITFDKLHKNLHTSFIAKSPCAAQISTVTSGASHMKDSNPFKTVATDQAGCQVSGW